MSQRFLLLVIAVTAGVTYLLRAVPLAILRRPLRNRYLVALLEYMPYALLSSMIFPDILYSTGPEGCAFPAAPPLPALVGTAVAVALALCRKSLPVVAGLATLAAYATTFLVA